MQQDSDARENSVIYQGGRDVNIIPAEGKNYSHGEMKLLIALSCVALLSAISAAAILVIINIATCEHLATTIGRCAN
jgi:hypothetical protein